jgi:hypothetical protein
MPTTKTYIVAPAFTLSPQSLKLGDLLVDPLSPELEPLNRKCRVPIDDSDKKETAIWKEFSSTRGELLSGRFGLWTSFLALLGVPLSVDLGLFLERNSKDVISAPELQTEEFSITGEYVDKVLSKTAVKAYLERREYKVPVYMVRGVKVAKGGAKVNVEADSTVDAKAGVGPGAGGTKPMLELVRKRSAGISFVASTDFILGFSVHKIVFKGGKVKERVLSTVGASMYDGGKKVGSDWENIRPVREGDVSLWPETENVQVVDETEGLTWLVPDPDDW